MLAYRNSSSRFINYLIASSNQHIYKNRYTISNAKHVYYSTASTTNATPTAGIFNNTTSHNPIPSNIIFDETKINLDNSNNSSINSNRKSTWSDTRTSLINDDEYDINNSNNSNSNNSNNSNDDGTGEDPTTIEFYKSLKEGNIAESIESFNKLAFKSESVVNTDIYQKCFEDIMEKAIDIKESFLMFRITDFFKENVLFFPQYVNIDSFKKFIDRLAEFDQENIKNGLDETLPYYSHLYKNTVTHLHQFHLLSPETLLFLMKQRLRYQDFENFDLLLQFYLLVSPGAKLSEISLTKSKFSHHHGSNNNLVVAKSFELMHLLVIKESMLNNLVGVKNLLTEMALHKMQPDPSIFQPIFELCIRNDQANEIENIFNIFPLMPSERIYTLFFYNQIKGNVQIFRRLESVLIKQPKPQQRVTIESIIRILLVHNRYELALDWFQKYTIIYTSGPSVSNLLNFAFYHSENDKITFYRRYWKERIHEFKVEMGYNIHIEAEIYSKYKSIQLERILNNIESYRELLTPIWKKQDKQLDNDGKNDNSDNSNYDSTPNPIPFTDKVVQFEKTDKQIDIFIEKGAIDDLIKYIKTEYFEKDRILPGTTFLRSIYLIRTKLYKYYVFLSEASPYYRSIFFDSCFYNTYLQMDLNKGISFLKQEREWFYNSSAIQNSILKSLLTMNQVEITTHMAMTMYKKKIDISKCIDFYGHKCLFEKAQWKMPMVLFNAFFKKKKSRTISNMFLTSLVDQQRYTEALDYIAKNPHLKDQETYKILCRRVYPILNPLNSVENLEVWIKLLEEMDNQERSKAIFYDNFFTSLSENGSSDVVVDIIEKDPSIITSHLAQTTLYLILKVIKDDRKRLEIFKKTRAFDAYYEDVINLLNESNQKIKDPYFDSIKLLKSNLHSQKKSPPADHQSMKNTLSDETKDFIYSNYIDRNNCKVDDYFIL
ncbi:hypothetical protein CYY_006689 [Polysphondylium violaceum]|uniref:Uncharacterized protein n=1 Tax=Polysphondylium violaceum TaxID=133409 RepID=A0A8J4UY36_9MYCE|nr:hypothetical protein CYY_006689 [Polysphondylium violaceum]